MSYAKLTEIAMSESNQACPICGEGSLHAQKNMRTIERNGYKADVALFFSVCDTCQSEQASAEQLKQNKRAMIAFRKKANNLLSGREVRRVREKLGLNQAQAASVLGGGPVAFSKYESDDTAQSEAMDNLIRVCEAVPSAFSWLLQRSGIEPESILKKVSWLRIGTSESLTVKYQTRGAQVATYDHNALPAANQSEYKAA